MSVICLSVKSCRTNTIISIKENVHNPKGWIQAPNGNVFKLVKRGKNNAKRTA